MDQQGGGGVMFWAAIIHLVINWLDLLLRDKSGPFIKNSSFNTEIDKALTCVELIYTSK